MTCVLGMVVSREREIRNFVKTKYYKVIGEFGNQNGSFKAEWKVNEKSKYFESTKLYNENGFKKESDAKQFITSLAGKKSIITELKKTKQKENAPLLFNLAEIQNECTKRFKIKPDETLEIIQNLYEKKLVTYPRTDARVLSTAVAKEISKNLNGIVKGYKDEEVQSLLVKMINEKYPTNLAKTKYVNDSKITDHYAIIPTGQGYENFEKLPDLNKQVYKVIVKRFLSIFYPPAEFNKISVTINIENEEFNASGKVCTKLGYLEVLKDRKASAEKDGSESSKTNEIEKTQSNNKVDNKNNEVHYNAQNVDNVAKKEANSADSNLQRETQDVQMQKEALYSNENEQTKQIESENKKLKDGNEEADLKILNTLKKGQELGIVEIKTKESETTPPTRYNTGSMILTMENAGKFIEDDTLREQIKGAGIGTSATRAEIIKKLERIKYISINNKTQIITPTLKGEAIYDVVKNSMPDMLNPKLTASWEKGLEMVAKKEIVPDEFMVKLENYIRSKFDKLVINM